MSTYDYTTRFTVNRSASEVFQSINNVSGWWQGEISGPTQKVNDEFEYRMINRHYSKQQIIEIIPDKKVVWNVIESELTAFSNQTEWTETKISFEINETAEGTELVFTHHGLVPSFECYGGCSGGWEALIQKSLFSLIITGKGKKVFG